MVTLGKMNKAQMIARIQELEEENKELKADLKKFASGEYENKALHDERENLKKEVEKLKEEKHMERQKVAVFHEWLTGDQEHFKDWLAEAGPYAPDGFYWDYVKDPINPDINRLTLVKEKSAIDYWKSCDGDEEDAPEALLNAIAEKCGLRPIDFEGDGCESASALGGLWDKIMDVMEER